MKNINDYETEAIADLKFELDKFDTYSMGLGVKKIKWSRYLYEEEKLSETASQLLKELYKKLYHQYTYEYEVIIDKKAIDVYIRGDETFQTADKACCVQKAKENFVRDVLKALDGQSFLLNSAMKYLLYQAGN